MGRIVSAKSRATILSQQLAQAPEALARCEQRLSQCLEQHRTLEQELGELDKKIADSPNEHTALKEASRRKKIRELAKVNNQLGEQTAAINRTQSQILSAKSRLREVAARTKDARVLLMKQSLVGRAHEILTDLLEHYEKDARQRITELINEILANSARREYSFRFTDGFHMDLFFPDDRPVPRSGGENQLMSLCFIASLVMFSVERAGGGASELLTPGTIAPLMLDSPFGQLDPTYRSSTARFVPKMAEQIVLLVSSSQGSEQVMDALAPHIGKQHVLVSENKGPQDEKPSDILDLNGRSITTSLYRCERTLTRIEEVSRA